MHPWLRDFLYCLAVAGLMWVGPVTDWVFRPDNPQCYPYARLPDVEVYIPLIERASEGSVKGDPFLWEHRDDPASVFSVLNAWPRLFGALRKTIGPAAFLVLGTIFSALWFFSLWKLLERWTVPRRFAFFMGGVACFFSVNLAYNFHGYKLNFAAWNLLLSEHLRAYPTVTSMAVYTLAVLLTYRAAASHTWKATIAPILCIAWIPFGRPFDWLVVESLIFLLTVFLFLRGDRRAAVKSLILLVGSGLLSFPMIWQLLSFQGDHEVRYLDQMWRGIYQAKTLSHYGRYTMLVLGMSVVFYLGFAWSLRERDFRRWPFPSLFSFLLVVSSWLPYYHTILSRITVTGFAYYFVFSFATWGTLALGLIISNRFSGCYPKAFHSRLLPAALVFLLALQQALHGYTFTEKHSKHAIPSPLAKAYGWVRENTPRDSVILSNQSGAEVAAETKRWIFTASPTVVALVTCAPSTELLERFLISEQILWGDVHQLQELFQPQGIQNMETWLGAQPLPSQQAFHRLRERIGFNSFIFHPRLNREDLLKRNITLPGNLSGLEHFVVYFPPALREVYQNVEGRSHLSLDSINPYRLDYVLLGPLELVAKQRLSKNPAFEKVYSEDGVDIWKRE
jgi:hypothetical protein